MKAVLLAAGKGERLAQLTAALPKPMLPFEGKPLLEHNIALCREHGIHDIYINLHHLPEAITGYFGDGARFDVRITYSYEEALLGTAGAVRRIADEYWASGRNEDFLVIYADNYSHYDIGSLISCKVARSAAAVIGFHYREDVAHSGVGEFDEAGRVLRFIEKPAPGITDSHWVNAGLYVCDSSLLAHIPAGVSDFSKDIFPRLLELDIPLYGVCEHGEVRAFDTPEMYRRNIR